MKNITILIFLIQISGCAYNVSSYSPSAKNVQVLQKSDIKPFKLTKFTSNEPDLKSIGCRAAGPITTPDGSAYQKYIYDAFVDELQFAGLYSTSAKTIRGHIESIDFSSTGTANWTFKVSFQDQNGNSAKVDSKYEFESAFVADKACQKVAQAFSPAVEKLISDVAKNSSFRKMLSQ